MSDELKRLHEAVVAEQLDRAFLRYKEGGKPITLPMEGHMWFYDGDELVCGKCQYILNKFHERKKKKH